VVRSGNERQHDVVAGLDAGDAFADLDDDAGSFVSGQDGQLHRRGPGDQVVIGVAEPGCFQLDLHLAGTRVTDVDLLHRPRFVDTPQRRALGLHDGSPFSVTPTAPEWRRLGYLIFGSNLATSVAKDVWVRSLVRQWRLQ
jgi:hypothetical protein